MIAARLLAVGICGVVALAVPALAAADLADEKALAAKYAPVVRLVEQLEECGPGEPYEPLDVDLLFDEPTVAFRGPWNRTDLIEIGPTADDLVEQFEYHLDFPGDPLDAGCSYELWARRLKQRGDHEPTVYAHVATEAARPGKLALQYWFFYPFNDFNNTHEGDWEMIQLLFDADDAAQALETTPTRGGVQLARGRRARRPGTTTTSSRSSTARTRSSTRRRAPTPTSSARPCISGARRSRVSAATTRSARTSRYARRY